MTMTPGFRKFTLTAHVTSSVGWLGAVAGFLVLAVAALTSQDVQVVRASFIVMELIGWFVLVPLSFASLVTGVVQSLGTKWGLFRHYWVLFKLLITLVSTIILLAYMGMLSYLEGVAVETTLSTADLQRLVGSPVIHSSAALLALLVATTLSVYKPQGTTPYGWCKQREQRTPN